MAYVTYREAARIVHRSTRTVRYWRQHGMPMEWEMREGQLVRVVDEDLLRAWWRDRLEAWPTQRWRLRAKLAALAAERDSDADG